MDRLNRREMLIGALPQIKNALPQQLSGVRSCAMIGCGNGSLELEFVLGCLPNIIELTAVEPDAHEMAELRTRVAQRLPTVKTDFVHETAQRWTGNEKTFEVVLLFNVLAFVPVSERRVLFKKLFDNIVTSGGLVFILTNIDHSQDTNTFYGKLKSLLGLPLDNYCVEDIDVEQVRDMMTSAGFHDCYELPIDYQWYVANMDNDSVEMYVWMSGGRLSADEVRVAFETVIGDRKVIEDTMYLLAFRRP